MRKLDVCMFLFISLKDLITCHSLFHIENVFNEFVHYFGLVTYIFFSHVKKTFGSKIIIAFFLKTNKKVCVTFLFLKSIF